MVKVWLLPWAIVLIGYSGRHQRRCGVNRRRHRRLGNLGNALRWRAKLVRDLRDRRDWRAVGRQGDLLALRLARPRIGVADQLAKLLLNDHSNLLGVERRADDLEAIRFCVEGVDGEFGRAVLLVDLL